MIIPPISQSYSSSPAPQESMVQQMWDLVEQYRALMAAYAKDPSLANLLKVENGMRQIASFLKTHEQAIMLLGKQMGWSTEGMDDFMNFFNGTLNSIQNFLDHPSIAALDMVNEQLTQLHWLLTHPNKHPHSGG